MFANHTEKEWINLQGELKGAWPNQEGFLKTFWFLDIGEVGQGDEF